MLLFQGKPHVELNIDGQEKLVAPEEVSAEILKEIKVNSEVSHAIFQNRDYKTNNIPSKTMIRRFYRYFELNGTIFRTSS